MRMRSWRWAALPGPPERLAAGLGAGHGCELGADCEVKPNTCIGGEGFGFANEQGSWEKIAQLGGVRIGDDVEIGANTTIDRGALSDTISVEERQVAG